MNGAVKLLALLLAAFPVALVMADEPKQTVRAGIYLTNTSGSEQRDPDFHPDAYLKGDGGRGGRVSYEWRFDGPIGLFAELSRTRYDFRLRQPGKGVFHGYAKTDATTLAVGILFHPLKAGRLDLYLGPSIAATDFTSADLRGGGQSRVRADPSASFRTGLDIALGRGGRWWLNIEASIGTLEARVASLGDQKPVGLSPVSYGLGAGFRF